METSNESLERKKLLRFLNRVFGLGWNQAVADLHLHELASKQVGRTQRTIKDRVENDMPTLTSHQDIVLALYEDFEKHGELLPEELVP